MRQDLPGSWAPGSPLSDSGRQGQRPLRPQRESVFVGCASIDAEGVNSGVVEAARPHQRRRIGVASGLGQRHDIVLIHVLEADGLGIAFAKHANKN
jgi:hypothetical protein